ncbi:MAG: hypothetical protein H6Q57_285 [Geobacteraceae bacterium]|nr:hypothetical protein [Geobacteraceae bacterium]
MIGQKNNGIKQYLTQIFIALYFIIFSIGIISILYMVSMTLTDVSQIDSLNRWVVNFWYPEKSREITHYILCVVGVAVYYILYYVMTNNKKIITYKLNDNIYSINNIIIILLISLISNILLSLNLRPGFHNIIPRAMIWGIIFIIPFAVNIKKINIIFEKIITFITQTKISFILLSLVTINLFYIIYPFVFQDLKIMNEFWDIPEKTIVHNKVIDNNNYIIKNKLIGRNIKYDVESKNMPTNDFSLNPFANNNENILQLGDQIYHDSNVLSLIGPIDEIIENMNANEYRDRLRQLYMMDNKYKYKSTSDTKEQTEFIKNNFTELQCQVLNRFWIHHHNHVIGPINEMNLGRDVSQIYMQYGWLNTVFLKSILNKLGGINYHNYSKLLFSFYYIYYVLFIALMFLIFRQINYVLPVTILLTAGLNKVSYPFFYIAPGMNPIRHFFDIFVIYFLYLYLKDKDKKRNKCFLAFSLVAALLGILNNNHVGMFTLISLVIALAMKNILDWKNKSYYEMLIMSVGASLGIFTMKYSKVGAQYMTGYFKAGLLGFDMAGYIMPIIFAAIGSYYIILIKQYKNENLLKYICTFLIMYSQGLLLYYVWGSDINHFIVFSPLFVFSIILLIKLVVENHNILQRKRQYLYAGILTISLLVYVPSVFSFFKQKNVFDNIFKSHITYEWDLPTAKFISTMNPEYFLDSIKLIQKYSDKNNIFIISKYDSFLPFLAGKYSAMPYFDVSWYLITNKEIDECIKIIENNKPRILFVDTDIDRSYEIDIVSKWSLLGVFHKESLLRYQRLYMLKKIYNVIKEHYVPIEKAKIITAYERKN